MRNTQKDTFVSTTSNITDWSSIDWKKTEKYVDKLQKRIYRAESEGDFKPYHSDKCLLEPIVMKATRWVLRREGGGDPSDLSDEMNCTFTGY